MVNPYILPEGTELEVHDLTSAEYEDWSGLNHFTVREYVPDNAPQDDSPIQSDSILLLDRDSVKVIDIESVEYSYKTHAVDRHRDTKSSRDRMLQGFADVNVDSLLNYSD